MRKMVALSAALMLVIVCSNSVFAQGGLERMVPTTRALFEKGNYFEFSWAHVSPELEGRGGALEPLGLGTGDILESYDQFGYAFKTDLNCCTSFAVSLEQPWGVNTNYPLIATSGYSGTFADLNAHALYGTFKRKLGQGLSVYGGVTGQTVRASASFGFGGAIGLGGPYTVVAQRDEGIGFHGGVGYEIEKIKARIALTYYSEIETNHATAETIGAVTTATSTQVTTPQSVNLEFQSGIAKDTLAFGSVRWVDWSKFAIAPPTFTGALGVPLVNFTEDWLTYTLGIGRRFNEYFSLATVASYTPSTSQVLTTLGPIDGRFSIGVAPTFTFGDVRITAGIRYIDLGEATNFAGTTFRNGDAIAVGVRTAFNF